LPFVLRFPLDVMHNPRPHFGIIVCILELGWVVRKVDSTMIVARVTLLPRYRWLWGFMMGNECWWR
jgi:hypothetical protein